MWQVYSKKMKEQPNKYSILAVQPVCVLCMCVCTCNKIFVKLTIFKHCVFRMDSDLRMMVEPASERGETVTLMDMEA